MYCASWRDKDGVEHKRNEWQDGWNAAIEHVIESQYKIDDFYQSLTSVEKSDIIYLLENDCISIEYYEETIRLYTNMNDTFYYACADQENVEIYDLNLLRKLYEEFSNDGMTSWVSVKRKQDPIDERNTQKFQEARNYLNSMENIHEWF